MGCRLGKRLGLCVGCVGCVDDNDGISALCTRCSVGSEVVFIVDCTIELRECFAGNPAERLNVGL